VNRIGVHLDDGDPAAQAEAVGASAVQFFLGDPQGWQAPAFPRDPGELKAAFAAAGVTAYVHAYYTINVASPNNRIRIPSRKLLEQQLAAAAAIGATGLIVHGGYVTAGADPQQGYDSWRKAIERIDRPLPMLIENTAGGDGAMARGLDGLARLWDVIGAAADDGAGEIGFCLDTCHAFASGEDLASIVDRLQGITGRIDLIHCNNSRDEFGSGRDRHASLNAGQIDPDTLVELVRSAGATAICETPDAVADMTWLRERLRG
jgi:deoxyribonuclease IV